MPAFHATILHALKLAQEITVRIAGHDHIARGLVSQPAQAILDALGITQDWHTPVARVGPEP